MTAATLNNGHPSATSTLLPTLSLIGAMASLCVGTSFAKSLFPEVGAQGTTAYRIVIGAIILLAFWRPWMVKLAAWLGSFFTRSTTRRSSVRAFSSGAGYAFAHCAASTSA